MSSILGTRVAQVSVRPLIRFADFWSLKSGGGGLELGRAGADGPDQQGRGDDASMMRRHPWPIRTLGIRGFTLLEVLLGSAVLVLGLLGVMMMFPVASINMSSSGGVHRGTALAQQRIEQLRNLPFTNLVALANTQATNPQDTPADEEQTVTEGNYTFTRRVWVTITNVTAVPLRRRADITVIVSWSRLMTGTGSVRLDGVVGE